MKKVYIAGPWVFRPDAKEHAEHLRKLVHDAGFEALIPIDNEVTSGHPKVASYMIKNGNRDMLRACDFVIADISPFRGPSADVGTAFEIGFAEALYKYVFVWSADQSEYKTRVVPDGMHVEDFERCDNLMITAGQSIHDSFEHALAALIDWEK